MITLTYKGRLGNNLIQYAAAHVLAKKTGLKLNVPKILKYSNVGFYKTTSSSADRIEIDFGSVFNVKPLTGDSFNDTIKLTDDNYFNHLENPTSGKNYLLTGFFQDARLLCAHRDDILKLYQYTKKPTIEISKDDAFFACRFGDCLMTPRTFCSIAYIENQLATNSHNYRNIYLTSDSLDYPPLVKLIDKYNITPYNNDPLNTILFACRFNNLILSAGSFSYWMAYLSQATNITVYNTNDPFQRKNAWDYNKNVKFSL